MDSRLMVPHLFLALFALSFAYGQDCGLPAIPAHATIQFDSFPIRPKTVATYACDPGFTLLGKDSRVCGINGTWSGFVPTCAVDVALGKPSKSSSQQGRIGPSIAVSGHSFGAQSQEICHVTKPEIAPWWSVNLLEPHIISSVRLVIGQSCCDDGPVYIEVRIGNDRDISRNALCGRYNGIVEEGAVLDVRCYRPLRGIFLSVHQLREVPNSLALCTVQAFSEQAITDHQCPVNDEKVDLGDVSTYSDQCYHFFNSQPDTYENAQMYCARRGGSLVWGTSPAFQAFISWAMAHRYNKFSPHNPNYWMGAMRGPGTNGEWMWIKGNTSVNPLRAFWSSRDPPSEYDGGTSCVMFDANAGWLWKETGCNRELNWICEFTPRTCGNPAASPNSTVQYSSTEVGSVAVYGCTGGLFLRGKSLRRCQPNGKWSDQPPVCTMDGCGVPTPVENSEIIYNATTVGAEAQYVCAPRYKPIGQTRARCTADGNWDPEPPQCVAVDCGPPPLIENGAAVLLSRQTSQGSRVHYQCQTGHHLVGGTKLVCSEREVWEGPVPFCRSDAEGFADEPPIAEDEVLTTPEPTTTTSTTTTVPSTRRTFATRPTTSTTTTTTEATTPTTTTLPTTTTTSTTTTPTTTTTTATTTTTTEPTTTTIPTTEAPTTLELTTTTSTTTTTTPTTTTSTTTTTTTTEPITTTELTTTTEPTTTTESTTTATTTESTTTESTTEPTTTTTTTEAPSTTQDTTTGTWAVLEEANTTQPFVFPVGWNFFLTTNATEATTTTEVTTTTEIPSTTSLTSDNSSFPNNGNSVSDTVNSLNGAKLFNKNDRSDLDALVNPFPIFTSPPLVTESRMPVKPGPFQANNAILLGGVQSTDPNASATTIATIVQRTSTRVTNPRFSHKAVGSLYDEAGAVMKDDFDRGAQSGNKSKVLTSTEVIMPTMAKQAGIGGWIALGVIVGLIILIIMIIIIACCVRRKRREAAAVQAVTQIGTTHYTTEIAPADSTVFNSRYRKAWDNLQLQLGANIAAGGKESPVSHATFKSTGPRKRDGIDTGVRASSEMTFNPSRAGTIKSLGGVSQAFQATEEIFIDDFAAVEPPKSADNEAGGSRL